MRTTYHEGRRHAIVPVTMLVEGVLRGSNGPLFYPRQEIENSTFEWNGKPVMRYHPELYSQPVMAALPEVHNRQRIGTVFNAKYSNGRLTADAFIDLDRAAEIDIRIVASLQGNSKMEVSTGVFIDVVPMAGVFNSRGYIGTACNLIPDHLAILPDQIGACSVKDGCGLNVVRNQARALAYA